MLSPWGLLRTGCAKHPWRFFVRRRSGNVRRSFSPRLRDQNDNDGLQTLFVSDLLRLIEW